MRHDWVVAEDPESSEPTSPAPVRAEAPANPRSPALVRLAVGFVALFACLFVFGRLADEVREREAIFLDAVGNATLHRLATPGLDALMSAATFLGSGQAIPVLFALALAALLVVRRRHEALFLAVAIGGSLAMNQLLKALFHRPRPQLDWAQVQPEFSFPSGHAQNGLVFYIGLAIVIWVIAGRQAGIAATVAASALVLLIGLSRVYFGYHYVSDVVAGYFAGLAWLLVVGGALRMGPALRSWPTPWARS
jgi:undecaprenyl-diphosphatase